VDVGLVDRHLLDHGRELAQQLHDHPGAHAVGVEPPAQEGGPSRAPAPCLRRRHRRACAIPPGLVGGGRDDAAGTDAADHDRSAPQRRLVALLHRGEERVQVHVQDAGLAAGGGHGATVAQPPDRVGSVLDHVTAVRYVTPLREGGSMPGVVEGSDLGTYVVKLRGAGQGLKVLVAEVIVGELARRIGLPVPRLVTIDLPPAIARYEADEEVQDLLNASPGTNLGVDLLPGSLGYDGSQPPPADLAARILWLDAFTANVDRTWSNPNLLTWHRRTWLIDHGAALYF